MEDEGSVCIFDKGESILAEDGEREVLHEDTEVGG